MVLSCVYFYVLVISFAFDAYLTCVVKFVNGVGREVGRVWTGSMVVVVGGANGFAVVMS